MPRKHLDFVGKEGMLRGSRASQPKEADGTAKYTKYGKSKRLREETGFSYQVCAHGFSRSCSSAYSAYLAV